MSGKMIEEPFGWQAPPWVKYPPIPVFLKTAKMADGEFLLLARAFVEGVATGKREEGSLADMLLKDFSAYRDQQSENGKKGGRGKATGKPGKSDGKATEKPGESDGKAIRRDREEERREIKPEKAKATTVESATGDEFRDKDGEEEKRRRREEARKAELRAHCGLDKAEESNGSC